MSQGSATALALLLTRLLFPTSAFAFDPHEGLAEALCFSVAGCCLLDFFLPPDLWCIIHGADDMMLCVAWLFAILAVWLGLITSAGTWWQFC